MRITVISALAGLFLPLVAQAADDAPLALTTVTEWKAVFAKVEARDNVPARSRIGGTLVEITVSEGDDVSQGQQIGTIYDAKLALRLESVAADINAMKSQLGNAETELARGEDLLSRGVTTVQRLDSLRTQVDVIRAQIAAAGAQKRVVAQQAAEGAVLAPIAGRVLDVPVTTGSVIMPGEPVAIIGGGGFFLRLAVPERHATFLREGAGIRIDGDALAQSGSLAKIYPQVENGRVIADVEVGDLDATHVDARVLVHLPIGETTALLVPADKVVTRMGLDFVTVKSGEGTHAQRTIVPGQLYDIDGIEMIEVLSGLREGDIVLPPAAAATPATPVAASKDHGHD